jgi:RNA-directed DNA polymerase
MEQRGSTVNKRADQTKQSPVACAAGQFKGYERLDWIHSAAKKLNDTERFRTLLHHFSVNNLKQAFRQLDGNKAVGIDKVTKAKYQENLQGNLEKLADEIHRGGWRPKPSREVLIPKPQGGQRPLAIGCLEDKIVQLLMSKILEAIYEPIFHRHSFGFRPGKNTHQAIARLYVTLRDRSESCTVVEMDIEKFFNSMDHEILMELISKRIDDQHVLRLIRRMLRNSIISEDGTLVQSERGSPQGAPVSPTLANIYLHYILDEWFEENWSQHGEIIRYADDAVFVFTDEKVANEFKIALQERMKVAGKLNLNADKTGILKFDKETKDGELPFLGFSFYWGMNKKNQKILKVKTSAKKLGKSIEAFSEWIKSVRNRMRLDKIWDLAAAKLRGHYQYYGVTFNRSKLNHFYFTAKSAMFKWLNRRSQKRSFTAEQFERRLMYNPLPIPPEGAYLLDITLGIMRTEKKRKPRSRMRELRTYGSNRSAGWQQLAFT